MEGRSPGELVSISVGILANWQLGVSCFYFPSFFFFFDLAKPKAGQDKPD